MTPPHNPVRSALTRLVSPPVLTGLLGAIVLLNGILAAVNLATLQPLPTPGYEPTTGDFLAFYTGGWMISHDQGFLLYNLQAQQFAQTRLIEADAGAQFLPYVNPPLLGALVSLTTPLGYRLSYLFFSLLNICALGLGLWRLRPHIPHLTSTPLARWTALGAVVAFAPVSLSLQGGQNTALTLGLLTLAYVSYRQDEPVRLGLIAGLLSYKPQYALLFFPLFLGRRSWKALAVCSATWFAHYGVGAWIAAPGWPLDMLAMLRQYQPFEDEHNAYQGVSLYQFTRHTLGASWASLLSYVAAPAILGLALRRTRLLAPENAGVGLMWALWLTGWMIVNPHLNLYESGLLVLPVLLGLEYVLATEGDIAPRVRFALLGSALLYTAGEHAETLGLQPMFFVLTGVWSWLLLLVERQHVAARADTPVQ